MILWYTRDEKTDVLWSMLAPDLIINHEISSGNHSKCFWVTFYACGSQQLWWDRMKCIKRGWKKRWPFSVARAYDKFMIPIIANYRNAPSECAVCFSASLVDVRMSWHLSQDHFFIYLYRIVAVGAFFFCFIYEGNLIATCGRFLLLTLLNVNCHLFLSDGFYRKDEK